MSDPNDDAESAPDPTDAQGSSSPSDGAGQDDAERPASGDVAEAITDATDDSADSATDDSADSATDDSADSATDDTAADTNADTTADSAASASVAAEAGIDEAVLDTPRTLESRVRGQWVLRSAVGAAVVGAVGAVTAYVVGSETALFAADATTAATAGVAAFALVAAFGVVRALLLYRSWEYVVREDSLYLSRGVFTRVRTVVPYVRVQHIDTTRNPVERALGLSTLVVYTAGSRGADVTIPGLTPDRANTLQRRLKRLAIESEEEDAV